MLICLLCGVTLMAKAQTNSVVFSQLFSSSHGLLMTNAEFRCVSGSRIFFKNDAGYQYFYPAVLTTNELAILHISAAELNRKQRKIDEARFDATNKWVLMPTTPLDNTPIIEENPADKEYRRQLEDCSIMEMPDRAKSICSAIEEVYQDQIQTAMICGDNNEALRLKVEMKKQQLDVWNIASQVDDEKKKSRHTILVSTNGLN